MSSDSDTDSTIISNTEGSQDVETDQWDFEETIGDKISNGNTFGVIVEQYHFKRCASNSGKEGGSVREDENSDGMITSSRQGLILCSIDGL